MLSAVIASRNQGKVAEFSELLAGSVVLVSPSSFQQLDGFDPEETGQTFTENALLKARAFAEKTGIAAIADDSGLVVDGLDGAPGVHSKRFFPGSDADRNARVLELLSEINSDDRAAAFVSVVAWVDPNTGEEITFSGEVNGLIAQSPAGSQGFGYDPIFIPDGYEATFAELGSSVKNKLSHRAIALEKLKQYLLNKKTKVR